MENKHDAIVFLENFQSKLKSSRILTIAVCTVSGFVAVLSIAFAFNFAMKQSEQIYILDSGSVLSAQRANDDSQIDLEARDHVMRFHELFFNVVPNTTSIERSISRALDVSDGSVHAFYSDLKEQRYYQNIIRNNAIQQIYIDSLKVDTDVYPYRARTWAKIYLMRESTITEYDFESSCEVSRIGRTEKNPHGMIVQKFEMTRYARGETKRRK